MGYLHFIQKILFSTIALLQFNNLHTGNREVNKNPFCKELNCRYTKRKIVIDAVLNENCWNAADSIMITDNTRRSDNVIKVKTLWDEQNLYIAFDVKDKNLQSKQTIQDNGQLSKDDIVEFLVDPANKKDSCWGIQDVIYHINLLSQKKDDRGTTDCKTDSKWNGNAKYAVKLFGTLNDSTDIDKGYVVEISILWEELGLKPSPGNKIGIDFGNGDSGIFFDWVGAHPFRSPYAFGDLILKK
jgi:hypothetical protein